MNFITSFYWQQGQAIPNSASLLLQQLSRRRGKKNLLFACVCEEERGERERKAAGESLPRVCHPGTLSGYMTERLYAWFYERALVECRNKRSGGLAALREGLKRTISQVDRELGGVGISVSGLICIESAFLYFYRGESELYFLNSRFERANLKRLNERTETLTVQYGEMKKGVGILLATHGFCESLGEQPLRECLFPREIYAQEQADKRMRELGCEAERRGVKNAGAVLAFTI